MSYEPYMYQQQTQVSREELARTRQTIHEFELHLNRLDQQVRMMQTALNSQDDIQRYSNLLFELNRGRAELQRHIKTYNEMIRLANVTHTSRLSEQAKREIYHLYHARRYTQDQLALQYGIQQSTVSKIVNGSAPPQPS